MMLLGVMGDQRVRKSLSPRMHNAALTTRGLEGVYLPLVVSPERVGEAVRGLEALGFAGANVTVPHKRAVVPFLGQLSEQARELGAVNTIRVTAQGLEGHNTDVDGCQEALELAGAGPQGLKALVVGAGGAARAAVLALRQGGAAQVLVASRRLAQAQELCDHLGCEPVGLTGLGRAAGQADLVINASAVSDPSEAPEMAGLVRTLELGSGCRLVMDLNYGRQQNFWRDLAQRGGAPFQDGLAMLAAQAAKSFSLWTGLNATQPQFFAALNSQT